MSAKPKKKFIVFEILKIVLSLLVINLHIESFVTGRPFSPIYYLGWYAVPIFVTLNFYFNSAKYLDKSSSNYGVYKLGRYIFPLIFWSVIGFTLSPHLITLKYVARQIITGTAVDAPLYYLTTMLYISLILLLLKYFKLLKLKNILIVILLLLFIEASGIENYLFSKIIIQVQLASIRIFEFMKYALLGISIPYIEQTYTNKVSPKLLVALSSFFIIIDVVYNWYTQNQSMGYNGILQFTAVMTLLLLFSKLKNVGFDPNKEKYILFLSTYSLGVYCIHSLLLDKVIWVGSSQILTIVIYTISLSIAYLIDKLSGGRLKPAVS